MLRQQLKLSKHSMRFPAIELVDRYTIARVKFEKTNGANIHELEFYIDQMKAFDINLIHQEVERLTEIHRRIWAMEDDFKKRRIDGASLEEIGQKALDIRDLNNHRVDLKNKIADAVSDAVKEIKQYGQ